MSQFRRAFAIWFVSFMAIFVVANLAGLVLHGTKVHGFGFPCRIVEWIEIGDWTGDFHFYPSSILINAVVCAAVSNMLALVCASSRARGDGDRNGEDEPTPGERKKVARRFSPSE